MRRMLCAGFLALFLSLPASAQVILPPVVEVQSAPVVTYRVPTTSTIVRYAPSVSYAVPSVSYAVPSVSYAVPSVSYSVPVRTVTSYSVPVVTSPVVVASPQTVVTYRRGLGIFRPRTTVQYIYP